MDTNTVASTPRGIPFRALGPFFALTFGLGWGLAILALLFTARVEALFGPVSGTNPVFILVVYTPAIAGVALVWWHCGVAGLGRYCRRLAPWRIPGAWWLFLLLGIPAVKYLGADFNGTATTFPFAPWYGVLPALVAALLIGAAWGLWHAPAFLLSGTPQSARSFVPYILGVLVLSVIVTPLFNAARGSILIPMLFHFQMNGPAWPDAQPWENYLFVAVAVAVVLLNRRAMLARIGAVTDALLPGAANSPDDARGAAPAPRAVAGRGGRACERTASAGRILGPP